MKRFIAVAIATIAVVMGSTASAQQPQLRGYGSYAPQNRGPSVIQHHASTFQEGLLRGYADLNRSKGDYNYQTSLGLLIQQHATTEFLKNKELGVQTYYNKKRIRNEYLVETAKPPVTRQDAENTARNRAPDRLNSYEYEPALGKVFWPALLKHDVFAGHRAEIDAAIARRSGEDSGLGSVNYSVIKANTNAMKEILADNIRNLPPQEYTTAKTFLNSLNYEAQHKLAPTGIASR